MTLALAMISWILHQKFKKRKQLWMSGTTSNENHLHSKGNSQQNIDKLQNGRKYLHTTYLVRGCYISNSYYSIAKEKRISKKKKIKK